MERLSYFEPSGNAKLDANLRRHIDALNVILDEQERKISELTRALEGAQKKKEPAVNGRGNKI